MMQRLPVESSDIVSVGYDSKNRVLEIEFQNARVYQYRDVEPEVYAHFMHADSHGRYFNVHINNRYRYEQVDAESTAVTRTMPLAFVTGNARKVRDLKLACAPYAIEVEQLNLSVDEIQSNDPADIALKKAKAAYKLSGNRPVVVQDTFWNILALHGFPGAFMSYITRWLSAEDFLRLMEGKQERTVLGTETLVYYDGKRHKAFVQDYQATVTDEPRGTGLFSIDRIVVLAGQTKTIAELEDMEGRSSINPVGDTLYTPFVKWLHFQRRVGDRAKTKS